MDSVYEHRQSGLDRVQVAGFVVAGFVCCVLGFLFAGFCEYKSADISPVVIAERINPNTAQIGSLVRLPNIGPKRAQLIVDYRQTVAVGELAFETAQDMEKIKGIGPKTVEGMKDLLCFE